MSFLVRTTWLSEVVTLRISCLFSFELQEMGEGCLLSHIWSNFDQICIYIYFFYLIVLWGPLKLIFTLIQQEVFKIIYKLSLLHQMYMRISRMQTAVRSSWIKKKLLKDITSKKNTKFINISKAIKKVKASIFFIIVAILLT